MHEPELRALLQKFTDGNLTGEEAAKLEQIMEADEELTRQILTDLGKNCKDEPAEDSAMLAEQTFLRTISIDRHKAGPSVLRKVHRIWIKYAAAAAIVIAFGLYIYIAAKNSSREVVYSTSPTDIPAGSDKAFLTLADGRIITLDSASAGSLAVEQGTNIFKAGDGRIVYQANAEKADEATVYNTMQTPRGGQYRLTLPDGTRVWLNAASSISFPVAFSGKHRKVKITGEVYFEVVTDKTHPFIAETGGHTVEVLGTKFNCSTYPDDPSTITTLIDGLVKIVHDTNNVVLRPGQQAVTTLSRKNILVESADPGQVTAWKDGAFGLENVLLETMLRQLSRWYDVEIVAPNGIPHKLLKGKMGRNLSLSQAVEVLGHLGVKCTIDNRKLILQ